MANDIMKVIIYILVSQNVKVQLPSGLELCKCG